MAGVPKGTALISDPDEENLGPAMLALNLAQRRFVLAMIEFPGITQSKAAQLAGYSNIKLAAKVRGHHLSHNEKVLAAIREVADRSMRSQSLMAANVLAEIAADSKIDANARLKAAGMLLDRTGFGAAQTINVNKTVTDVTEKGIEDRLQRAMARLRHIGRDPAELLGLGAPVVEAEFSEIKDGD